MIITNTSLSNAQLLTLAPSIFAEKAHSNRSDRYGFVPTIEVVKTLRKAGYLPVQAFQAKARQSMVGNEEFMKHTVRFRLKTDIENAKANSLLPDVILTNSHNGTTSFKMEAGLYRMVCSNGLTIKSESYGEVKIQHSGNIADRVREGADFIIDCAPKALEITKAWDRIQLTPRQRINFAREALTFRYGETVPHVTPEQILVPRRNADEGNSLWRVFNVVQENLEQGGINGVDGRGKDVVSRPVTSGGNSLRANRQLWELAETFAKRNR